MNKKSTHIPNLSIGEISRRSGLPVSTIHYYESKGLINCSRSASNHRRYSSDVLRYLAVIKVAQRTGISLVEVYEALGPYKPGKRLTAKDWRAIAAQWRNDLDERIKNLQRLRDELDSCIGCGCLSLKECPLRNPGDNLSTEGPGARILEREA
ncbi:redox-sensitive transcriptional activator SoxR [Halomonas sp. YLB-10]|uniref:redox-sensitive transcriptional activator SoxR n=1 Tax=unclassified Halomonas TaxID=2609666 RepID=UPI000F5EE160|nr:MULTISPECIES: redox-sensitive transcriptional activator SoxR [unclassified Halomonas]RQW68663.1 redox-sensitive transcriptional activator SoxR [Halomonas sp. YLB-10]